MPAEARTRALGPSNATARGIGYGRGHRSTTVTRRPRRASRRARVWPTGPYPTTSTSAAPDAWGARGARDGAGTNAAGGFTSAPGGGARRTAGLCGEAAKRRQRGVGGAAEENRGRHGRDGPPRMPSTAPKTTAGHSTASTLLCRKADRWKPPGKHGTNSAPHRPGAPVSCPCTPSTPLRAADRRCHQGRNHREKASGPARTAGDLRKRRRDKCQPPPRKCCAERGFHSASSRRSIDRWKPLKGNSR